MRVISKKVKEVAKGLLLGMIIVFMRVNGKMITLMVKVFTLTLMGVILTERLKVINFMKVNIPLLLMM